MMTKTLMLEIIMPMTNNIIMRHDCLIVLMMLVMTIIENIILIILAMLHANMMTMLNILASKRLDLMRTGINDALFMPPFNLPRCL